MNGVSRLGARSGAPWLRGFVAALAFVAVGIGAGCDTQKNVWQAGIPSVGTRFTVQEVSEHGPVRRVVLGADHFSIVSFLPLTEACLPMASPGSSLEYRPAVPAGRWVDGEQVCEAVGIGSLNEWRARGGRREGEVVPRAQASYAVVHRDAGWVFLRGRFPLANRLRWTGGEDLVAVVANAPECSAAVDAGVASMEFRSGGSRPLALVSAGGLCEIQGLILSEVWRG